MQPFYEDSEQEPASATRSILPEVESDRAVLATGPSISHSQFVPFVRKGVSIYQGHPLKGGEISSQLIIEVSQFRPVNSCDGRTGGFELDFLLVPQ
jgi:hypothetical protein